MPVHYEIELFGDTIGILTIPQDPDSGEVIVGDQPTLVRFSFENVCYTGNLDTINNRLTLTEL